MNLDEIRSILELMREHDVAEFELDREGVKLRLRKTESGNWAAHMPPLPQVTYATPVPQAPGAPSAPVQPPQPSTVLSAAAEEEDVDLAIVKSPIVGTFYRSSEPGSKPFVEIGQMVRQGQVLCIIEAMKLMNEIAAECDGEIAKIYVENAHAVQYGERLFAIKPA